MGASFAPNHKGMPHPDGTEDYLRKQVLTSRNVNGGWLTDAALGGLNYQIEHHLFPKIPRNKLQAARLIVRDYCSERSIRYHETTVWGSYVEVTRYLQRVVTPIRTAHQSSSSAPPPRPGDSG